MDYSFAPHLEAISLETGSASQSKLAWFALIDAGQLTQHGRGAGPLLADSPSELLFRETFASAAMNLSPRLIALAADNATRTGEISSLDASCRHLPIFALLGSTHTLADLAAHLRSLLLVVAASNPYLLRFADTQMVAAIHAVFTPAQRARVCHGIEAWFIVSHEGEIDNIANPERHAQQRPAAELPLCLDDEQTEALMVAVGVPVLASQLRNLDGRFAERLTHAEQTRFATNCLGAACMSGIDLDAELVSMALQRWQVEVVRLDPAA